MRASKRAALFLLAAMPVAFATTLSAHRLDELLQAARIAVEPDGVQVEMSLTPGIAVADGILRDIDADGNGVLSGAEQRVFAGRVLSALTLRVDDSAPLQLELVSSTYPGVAEIRSGDGVITIHSEVAIPSLPAGPHSVFFRKDNAAGNAVYLANALVPESNRVSVTGQKRAGDQSELTIDFVVQDTPARFTGWWGLIGLAGAIAWALGGWWPPVPSAVPSWRRNPRR